MEDGFGQRTDGELLAGIDAVLDALLDDRLRLPPDAEQLALLEESLRVGARFEAWQRRLAAGVEAGQAAWHEHRTSTTTWLAETTRLTPRAARRLVAAGQGLVRFGVVAAAAASGAVLPEQAEAITGVLDAVSEDLPAEELQRAQELMVGFASDHNAVELRRLAGRLVEVLDPEGSEVKEAARLERERRVAMQNRNLRFVHDHQGSVTRPDRRPLAGADRRVQPGGPAAAQGRPEPARPAARPLHRGAAKVGAPASRGGNPSRACSMRRLRSCCGGKVQALGVGRGPDRRRCSP